MRMIIYLLVIVAGLLLVAFGVLGVLGSRLPETHTSTVTLEVPQARQVVFTLLERVEDMPSWVPSITKVERLADKNGLPVFRQHMGRNSFVTETAVHEPMRRIQRDITDDLGPFSGSWDHVLDEAGPGRTKVTLTEVGRVKSPVPRAIMHYFMGEDMYLKKFAADLTKKCGG